MAEVKAKEEEVSEDRAGVHETTAVLRGGAL